MVEEPEAERGCTLAPHCIQRSVVQCGVETTITQKIPITKLILLLVVSIWNGKTIRPYSTTGLGL